MWGPERVDALLRKRRESISQVFLKRVCGKSKALNAGWAVVVDM